MHFGLLYSWCYVLSGGIEMGDGEESGSEEESDEEGGGGTTSGKRRKKKGSKFSLVHLHI